jgi:hypothetical protein
LFGLLVGFFFVGLLVCSLVCCLFEWFYYSLLGWFVLFDGLLVCLLIGGLLGGLLV